MLFILSILFYEIIATDKDSSFPLYFVLLKLKVLIKKIYDDYYLSNITHTVL